MTPTSNDTTALPTRFRVGEVVADAGANELTVAGTVQRIEGRTMAVLVYLAQQFIHLIITVKTFFESTASTDV